MLVKLDETIRLVETLVVENTSLEEKVKNLEVKLSQARTQIERMSSIKLDEVLSAQKPSSDKIGLGYDVSFDPFSSTASRSRTVFVPQSEKGNKGMKSKTDLANSKSIIVFLDTFFLIALSCILISNCPNGHRFSLKDLYLCLESY